MNFLPVYSKSKMCKSFKMMSSNVAKWCHQMLQNDVIKCCKMMSPHSNEPATWRNCFTSSYFDMIHYTALVSLGISIIISAYTLIYLVRTGKGSLSRWKMGQYSFRFQQNDISCLNVIFIFIMFNLGYKIPKETLSYIIYVNFVKCYYINVLLFLVSSCFNS